MISLLPASNIEIDEDPSATGRPLKSPLEVPSGMPSFEPDTVPAVRSAIVAEHSRSKAGKAAAITLDGVVPVKRMSPSWRIRSIHDRRDILSP